MSMYPIINRPEHILQPQHVCIPPSHVVLCIQRISDVQPLHCKALNLIEVYVVLVIDVVIIGVVEAEVEGDFQ